MAVGSEPIITWQYLHFTCYQCDNVCSWHYARVNNCLHRTVVSLWAMHCYSCNLLSRNDAVAPSTRADGTKWWHLYLCQRFTATYGSVRERTVIWNRVVSATSFYRVCPALGVKQAGGRRLRFSSWYQAACCRCCCVQWCWASHHHKTLDRSGDTSARCVRHVICTTGTRSGRRASSWTNRRLSARLLPAWTVSDSLAVTLDSEDSFDADVGGTPGAAGRGKKRSLNGQPRDMDKPSKNVEDAVIIITSLLRRQNVT